MKRFYQAASVAEDGAGWRVLLDGRAVRTAGGGAQVLPTRALADALAAEWAAQGETLDPAGFPLRDLSDYALDVVARARAATIAGVVAYAETDTLLYRAEPDEPLFHRQRAVWEPIVTAAEARYAIHFERVSGIVHRSQPAATLARLTAVLAGQDDFTLASLNTLASLAASLTVALAAIEDGADVAALWSAAELEELWQVEQWGSDWEAELRRTRRTAAFASAVQLAVLARP